MKDIENIEQVENAMMDTIVKLGDLLKQDNRDKAITRETISISTAMAGSAKAYLMGVALKEKIKNTSDCQREQLTMIINND